MLAAGRATTHEGDAIRLGREVQALSGQLQQERAAVDQLTLSRNDLEVNPRMNLLTTAAAVFAEQCRLHPLCCLNPALDMCLHLDQMSFLVNSASDERRASLGAWRPPQGCKPEHVGGADQATTSVAVSVNIWWRARAGGAADVRGPPQVEVGRLTTQVGVLEAERDALQGVADASTATARERSAQLHLSTRELGQLQGLQSRVEALQEQVPGGGQGGAAVLVLAGGAHAGR